MATLKNSRSALRHKQFQLYLSIRFLLSFAAQWQTTVLGFYVYQLTHSKMAIAFIGLSEVIPAIGMALYGGYITDKSNKRTLLLWSNLALVLVSVGLLAAHHVVFMIYVLLFVSGFARAFYEPALFAVYTGSVPRSEYAGAASWNNLSWQVASVTGPLAAGFGYALAGRIYPGLSGISLSFIVVSLLLLSSLVLVGRLRVGIVAGEPAGAVGAAGAGDRAGAGAKDGMRESILAGLRFVFRTKPLFYAMNLDLFSVFFGGVSALLPVYALDILKVGAEGLGIMRMVMSAGAALSMLLAARLPVMHRPWCCLLIAAGGFGVCVVGFGFSGNFILSLIFLFGQGAFDSISVLIRSTLLQFFTPAAMRGRVSAVNSMFIASSAEIGDFESGVMASLLGTVPAVLLGGCITLAVVIFTFTRTGQLVRYSVEELAPAPAME
jgi:MFS family permease